MQCFTTNRGSVDTEKSSQIPARFIRSVDYFASTSYSTPRGDCLLSGRAVKSCVGILSLTVEDLASNSVDAGTALVVCRVSKVYMLQLASGKAVYSLSRNQSSFQLQNIFADKKTVRMDDFLPPKGSGSGDRTTHSALGTESSCETESQRGCLTIVLETRPIAIKLVSIRSLLSYRMNCPVCYNRSVGIGDWP